MRVLLRIAVLMIVAAGTQLAGVNCAFAAEEVGGESAYVEPPVTDDDRDHWSFHPVTQPAVPKVPGDHWSINAIDHFVVRRLAEEGLTPQPAASRRTLIRRATFDLTGLPPTPAEIDALETNLAADAYESLIDRLLDSPRYGERWAQHWLDLARFAETDGFEHDKVREDAWQYRDWVITALNADMPYDQFVMWQIAGDELAPDNSDAVTATRFCLSGPDMPDINLPEERRHNVLNELVSTVGESLMGLQLGCAQCHDHKYDPISQADFYRLRAVFDSGLQLKKNQSLSVMRETGDDAGKYFVMLRGDFRSPGTEVEPGVIRVIDNDVGSFHVEESAQGTGRRSALARWLVDRRHPLTARVIVNRVWQHHFGHALVQTPSDFGVMGLAPEYPELLDWLAADLIEHDWSLKHLHRRIMGSATYRQRSFLPKDATAGEQQQWTQNLQEDRDCELFSRYPRWRLEGEAIRDAMLFAAGDLSLEMGGSGVRPPLPSELVGTLLRNQWKVTEDESQHVRRSVYLFARRNLRYPMFEVFDRPAANVSCPQRNESTTAPQSLHLLNSEFSLEMAEHLAERIASKAEDRETCIQEAFARTLGREPDAVERSLVQGFWAEQASGHDALVHLCLALFNSSEFITID